MTANASAATARPLATRAEPEQQFSLSLRLSGDYTQVIDFGLSDETLLAIDEPPPLGSGSGPNPARLLAAAVGGCLGASLLYCLRKARVEVDGLTTKVEGSLVRNERGRVRLVRLRVALSPAVPTEARERMTRCLEVFEDYCVVTESVRSGIEVDVQVDPVAPSDAATPGGRH
jgi:uncharacterized OsmC-like protein